jgi:hypothetical protein
MTTQNYCMVNQQTNICDNVCVWDGNPSTWTPPSEYLMLVQATTPSIVWSYNDATNVWSLVEVMGQGGAGFTWNGSVLTTSDPQPTPPVAG